MLLRHVGEAAQTPVQLTNSLFLFDCLTEPVCLLSRHEDNVSADLHGPDESLKLHLMKTLSLKKLELQVL